MIINYNDDITKQEFVGESSELKELGVKGVESQHYWKLGELNNPSVVLDGNKLSEMQNGDLIGYIFRKTNGPVGTMYDGTVTNWFKLPGTWPATLDSLVHLRGQRKSNSLCNTERILDVGCGTGIAGNYAYQKNGNIKRVDYSDINPNNVKTALMNTGSDYGIVSKGFENVKEKYDAILASAVPAMPVYPGLKREVDPLFEGTEFLEDILRESPNYLNKGGKLILSHSSMADSVFHDWAKNYGAKVNNLDSKEIAFREDFLDDKNWVDYLVDLGGLKFEEKNGHKYWHDIKVKEISFE